MIEGMRLKLSNASAVSYPSCAKVRYVLGNHYGLQSHKQIPIILFPLEIEEKILDILGEDDEDYEGHLALGM